MRTVINLRSRRIQYISLASPATISLLLVLFLFVALREGTNPALAAAGIPSQTQAEGTPIVMKMSVGTDPNVLVNDGDLCGTTQSLTLFGTQKVYLCYEITNTSSITYEKHMLISQPEGPSFDEQSFILGPVGISDTAVFSFALDIDSSKVITSSWVSKSQTDVVTVTNAITIVVLNPNLAITYTVGLDQTRCGDSNRVTSFLGGNVVHCIQLYNSGSVTLTNHTIQIPAFGFASTFPYELAPGQVITINEATRASYGISSSLVSSNVTNATNYSVQVASYTASSQKVEQSANASADIFTKGLSVRFALNDKPNLCPTSDTVPVINSQYYLCIEIRNSSNITYSNHTISLYPQNVVLNLAYDVGPSGVFSVTSANLVIFKQPLALLGPYTMIGNLGEGMVITSSNASGFSEIQSIERTIIVATPTPTPTPTQTATSTPRTPSPDTPTWTPTAGPPATWTATVTPPPTDSATPTLVPTLTSTVQSFAISILETPTSAVPTLDPNAPFATQTQIALEQTAQAAQLAQSQPPTIDPIIQMTEQALFATQTYEAMVASGQIPPAVDPNATPTPPVVDPNSVVPSLPEQTIDPQAQAMLMAAPASQAPESPLESPTLTLTPEPTIRPIILPTPPLTASTLSIFGIVTGRILTVAGWIWLFTGALVFLLATLILMAMVIRSLGPNDSSDQFDLVEDDEIEDSAPPAPSTPSSNPTLDDWPDSLP